MLVQTMNAISLRFQNVGGAGERDPLASWRSTRCGRLNNLLWGYIQDEQHRLTRAAPRLRVRPPVRHHADGQGRPAVPPGRQPLEVPRGVPQPAAPGGRCSTSRTTTRRSSPTASRC